MGRLGPCPTTGHRLTSEARALALLGDGVQVDRSTPASGPHCPPALRAPRSPAELPECRQHRSRHPSATPSSLPSPQGAEGTVGSGEQSRVGMVQLRARWTSLELGGGVWAGDGSRKQPQGTAKENTLPGSCGTSKLRAEAAEGTVRSGRAEGREGQGHGPRGDAHEAGRSTCVPCRGRRGHPLAGARPVPSPAGAMEAGARWTRSPRAGDSSTRTGRGTRLKGRGGPRDEVGGQAAPEGCGPG